ncbi:MAG TPA: hypothetical protein VGE93_02755 [Bryobacteraceae bacterium]
MPSTTVVRISPHERDAEVVSVSPAVHPEQRLFCFNADNQTVIQTLSYAVITDSGLGAREQLQETIPRAEELADDRDVKLERDGKAARVLELRLRSRTI